MKLNNRFRIFSEIKLFLKSDSTFFLLNIFKKRKNYLFLNIFSGLADSLLEIFVLSMLYFVVFIITSENKNVINWENIFFINKFSFLFNYLNSISFRSIFVFSILITVLVQILQLLFRYLNNLSTSWIEAAYLSLITNIKMRYDKILKFIEFFCVILCRFLLLSLQQEHFPLRKL